MKVSQSVSYFCARVLLNMQIAVGSTNVRVGSIIFGARDYHTSTDAAVDAAAST